MRGIEGLQFANHGTRGGCSRQLVEATQEFEAQLMKELLKPLSSEMSEEENQETGLGSGNVLSDFASEALGRALSQRGGIGIAHELLQNFAQKRNGVESGDMTGKLHQNVLINSAGRLE